MANKITPLFNHILIKPVEKKSVLASQSINFCDYGEVIKFGPECPTNLIEVGDVIAYTVWGLNHIEIDGTKHFLVPYDSRFILGLVTLSE